MRLWSANQNPVRCTLDEFIPEKQKCGSSHVRGELHAKTPSLGLEKKPSGLHPNYSTERLGGVWAPSGMMGARRPPGCHQRTEPTVGSVGGTHGRVLRPSLRAPLRRPVAMATAVRPDHANIAAFSPPYIPRSKSTLVITQFGSTQFVLSCIDTVAQVLKTFALLRKE
ncbi:unnamed protein product [Angiostrongylus costaricensis]|uniref:Uncharacterized protein n=1 Tax=Angiostrongylus costaricensis TaxID=334426 RepID=A0A0R3PXY6_ANGCS|nr:unnamed protein product [Angiostrongylus costaricensis]